MVEDADRGSVTLFGKMAGPNKQLVTGAVSIDNCFRTLLVTNATTAPIRHGQHKETRLDEVVAEVLSKAGIKELPRARPPFPGALYSDPALVQKKYAFEIFSVPRESTPYVEMPFPVSAKVPKTGTTFRHLFGSDQSMIEGLIIRCALAGPSWIRLSSSNAPRPGPKPTCVMPSYSIQYIDSGLTSIENPPPAPPLKVMTLGFSFANAPSSAPDSPPTRQVQAVAGVLHREFPLADSIARPSDAKADFALGTRTPDCPNERKLLERLCDVIQNRNPDVLLGHGIDSGDLDTVASRMRALKVDSSALGRIPGRAPFRTGFTKMYVTHAPGRVLVDTLKLAREHMPPQRDYSIDALCPRIQADGPTTPTLDGRDEAVCRAWQAMRLAVQLEALSLSARLTMIGGNLWRRTLAGGRAERIEYLLLHAFHRAGYVVPDKGRSAAAVAAVEEVTEEDDDEAENGGSTAAVGYKGGKVLEPSKGLYLDLILVMDFASLYPSIIMEKNICFTTLDRLFVHGGEGKDDDDASITALASRDPNTSRAVLPSVIAGLVAARQSVRKEMKGTGDQAKRAQLNVHQLALKITANSMYGCLGFSSSRFYAKNLAAAVTGEGRLLLRKARQATESMGYEVIYGDTDSIMVKTKLRPGEQIASTELEEVKGIASQIEAAVNESFNDIRLATESVFCPLLLLQKKKYGAVAYDLSGPVPSSGKAMVGKTVVKGLDLVRRDWCPASRRLGKHVLEALLSRGTMEQVVTGVLQRVGAFRDLADSLPLEDWVVGKAVSKEVHRYAGAVLQPHVVVAKAMVAKGIPVARNDHVRYVICSESRSEVLNEPKQGILAEHAFSPEEHDRYKLHVDIEWYLEKQILPPILRLVEPLKEALEADMLKAALRMATKTSKKKKDKYMHSAESE